MTDKERRMKVAVALNTLVNVWEDTDEELWAAYYLGGAIAELEMYFEEEEV